MQVGSFANKQDLQLMVLRIKRELDRQMYLQIKQESAQTIYVLSVGLFSEQADAFEYLDRIVTYYPGAKSVKKASDICES